uniref:Uncharacterized protein n=1 Tax=Triticum urartu TaxID=4572 RepID=A0A8R7R1B8_TRIUA
MTGSGTHFSMNSLMFFNQTTYSLSSLVIMYSCSQSCSECLIPLTSRYLWKDFCKFSSRSENCGPSYAFSVNLASRFSNLIFSIASSSSLKLHSNSRIEPPGFSTVTTI